MQQRGRRSAASLSVVPIATIGQRPPAPSYLSAAEKTEWQAIVGALPADWFPRETHPTLSALVRHTCRARLLGSQAAKCEEACIETEEGLKILDRLLAMLERESRAVMALSRSLRLTKQSRVDKGAAGRMTSGSRGSYYDTMRAEDDD